MPTRPVQYSSAHEVDLLLANELLGPARAMRTAPLTEPPGLQLCPECERPFVVPGQIRELVGEDAVRLDLSCTNCGATRTEVHDDARLTDLDHHLDRSFADLLWTLEVVWIANEEAAIDRFAAALAAGAILPEDF